LLSKPGILFRTCFRPLELNKKGQGKETLILQSGPRLPSVQLVIAVVLARKYS